MSRVPESVPDQILQSSVCRPWETFVSFLCLSLVPFPFLLSSHPAVCLPLSPCPLAQSCVSKSLDPCSFDPWAEKSLGVVGVCVCVCVWVREKKERGSGRVWVVDSNLESQPLLPFFPLFPSFSSKRMIGSPHGWVCSPDQFDRYWRRGPSLSLCCFYRFTAFTPNTRDQINSCSALC